MGLHETGERGRDEVIVNVTLNSTPSVYLAFYISILQGGKAIATALPMPPKNKADLAPTSLPVGKGSSLRLSRRGQKVPASHVNLESFHMTNSTPSMQPSRRR